MHARNKILTVMFTALFVFSATAVIFDYNGEYSEAAAPIIPVTDITGVPTSAAVGVPLTLTGTVVPATATYNTITWSLTSVGTTGATLSGSTLNTTSTGTAVVTATVAGGGPAEFKFISTSAICNVHSMGIKADGTLWGWGGNGSGQIGIGAPSSNVDTPTQIGTDKWTAVSCGYLFTVGIKEDGTLWAWGNNGFGQLGNGNTDFKSAPVPSAAGTWKSVSAG